MEWVKDEVATTAGGYRPPTGARPLLHAALVDQVPARKRTQGQFFFSEESRTYPGQPRRIAVS